MISHKEAMGLVCYQSSEGAEYRLRGELYKACPFKEVEEHFDASCHGTQLCDDEEIFTKAWYSYQILN